MFQEKNFELNNSELEAEIYYLTKEEGGRATPVFSGYRGQFFYDNANWDAAQQLVDKQFCDPGNTVKALIQTASPSQHIGKFFIGKPFEIREGATIVGKGKITKILEPTFQKKDKTAPL
jgi:translation elongation factor EF-Tu-like GTPase